MTLAYAQVALPLPLKQTFTYTIPDELSTGVQVGSAVLVPFRQGTMTGYVVDLASQPGPDAPKRLRDVAEVLDQGPLFTPDLLSVTKWMAEYYICGWGEVLKAAVPDGGAGRRKNALDIDEVPLPEELETTGVQEEFPLTSQQQKVLVPLLDALHARRYLTAVLHGVTASGKTAIYEKLVEGALEQGRGAIVLVPEISITPQMVSLFRARFRENVALFHSRLKPRDRFVQWKRVLSGEASVVIGPRSAVLAPVREPAVIVVDEEHESSYKQSEPSPRYHARDVAVFRAREMNALCVLGSATPSAESYRNALEGKYLLLEMPERVTSAPMPKIQLIDLASEEKPQKGGSTIFSRLLEEAIESRLEKGEQSILFLNRRGFSPAVTCRDCGEAHECGNCSVAMTYHQRDGILRCHYCGATSESPESCPSCGSADLRYQGLGTQRVESALLERFPGVQVIRMDSDTTRKRGSHGRLYHAFARGEGDILLGTQMVAKGFHFPRVTLVGVISADAEMHFPDFRANERTYQLLTQVAGRAGRGDRRGDVVIQTFAPDNPGVTNAVKGDFMGFMAGELQARKALGYPPYGKMVRIVVRGREEDSLLKAGREAVERLRGVAPRTVTVLGPAPAPLYRLNRWFRSHAFLRGASSATLRRCIEASGVTDLGRGPIVVTVDVDPVDVL